MPDGYRYAPGLASLDFDIDCFPHLFSRPLAVKVAACDARTDCAGILGHCLKYYVRPLDQMVPLKNPPRCAGTYIKTTRSGCDARIPGFFYYANKQSPGSTTEVYPGLTPRQVADKCRRCYYCRGITTSGEMKSALRPEAQWLPFGNRSVNACVGTYEKIDSLPYSCDTSIPNYTFYPNIDSRGGGLVDAGRLCADDLATKCTAQGRACVGFNTEGKLKAVLKPLSEWKSFFVGRRCAGTFVKNS